MGITIGDLARVSIFSTFLLGSFSAVSTPIFASKVAFFSVFRALHFFLCTIPDFSELQEIQQILQIFIKFSPNFFRISQNFSDFDRSDVKMMIFHENLRKIAENFKHFVAKILKICPKKMYALNRYGGNTGFLIKILPLQRRPEAAT